MKNQISLDEAMQLEVEPFETEMKLRKTAKDVQKYLICFRTTFKDLNSLFLRLEQMDIGLEFCMRSGDINLAFVGDGTRLADVWRELRQHGYKPDNHPKKGKAEFCTWFRKDGYATVWLSFASTLCRRVQTGTRTVQEPIYEVVCGDLPEIQEDEPKEIPHDIPF